MVLLSLRWIISQHAHKELEKLTSTLKSIPQGALPRGGRRREKDSYEASLI